MDPPEFRTHDLRDALGPFGAGIRRDDQIDIQKGGPIATAFGYQRPYLRKGEDYPQAHTRDLEQPKPRAKLVTPPGRRTRAGDVSAFEEQTSAFPSEFVGVKLGSKPPRPTLSNEQNQSFGRVHAGSQGAVFYRRPGGRRQKPARKEETAESNLCTIWGADSTSQA